MEVGQGPIGAVAPKKRKRVYIWKGSKIYEQWAQNPTTNTYISNSVTTPRKFCKKT
jgi:hypothetical protein